MPNVIARKSYVEVRETFAASWACLVTFHAAFAQTDEVFVTFRVAFARADEVFVTLRAASARPDEVFVTLRAASARPDEVFVTLRAAFAKGQEPEILRKYQKTDRRAGKVRHLRRLCRCFKERPPRLYHDSERLA